MKNQRIFLLLSIIQLALGFLWCLSFIVLAVNDYEVSQYISTFILGLIFVAMGIVGVVKWIKKNGK